MSAINNSAARPAELSSKFEGSGVEYAAKYLGCCDVADGQSQLLCQEAMRKILAGLKGRKEPKERLKISLSLDGVRMKEGSGAVEDGDGKRPPLDLNFRHCEVSYVYKEPRDQRSCALVRTETGPDGQKINKFYAIRTLKSANPLLQDLRQLFQLIKESQERLAGATGGAPETAAARVAAADADNNPAKESPQPLQLQPVTPAAALEVAASSVAVAPVVAAAPEDAASRKIAVAREVAPEAAAAPEIALSGVAAATEVAAPAATQTVTEAAAPAATQTRGVDLLDMSEPEKPVRQSMVSSSAGSLDELNELFSSQASIASSAGGGGGGGHTMVSFNPWANQTPVYHNQHQLQMQQQMLPMLPPYMMLSRQLSHPQVHAYAREPTRKSSHPNMLEQSHLASEPVYHDNKRPSDPGLLNTFVPLFHQYQQQPQAEFYGQCQPEYQQQPQAAFYGQCQPEYQQQLQPPQQQQVYGPYAPVYTTGHIGHAYTAQTPTSPISPHSSPHHYQPPPVWPVSVPQTAPPPPSLPPTSSTPLLDGDFVSVFDQPEQQPTTKTA